METFFELFAHSPQIKLNELDDRKKFPDINNSPYLFKNLQNREQSIKCLNNFVVKLKNLYPMYFPP